MGFALDFLSSSEDAGVFSLEVCDAEGEFLNKIVTGNETWIFYIHTETKLQLMIWRQYCFTKQI